ncbi:MAG: carbon storage regulator [Pseudomonadota bacterium]
MLQLTRKEGERIVIGDGIEVVVLGVSRGEVRLGVRAPRSVAILRGEIADRVAQSNRDAASAPAAELVSRLRRHRGEGDR